MPGKMTLKGLIEEELMEAESILDHHEQAIDEVLNLLEENERKDKLNDKVRREVRRYLRSAKRNHKMRNFEDADNDIYAADQKLDEQEEGDLEDDIPRTKAIIKLSKTQATIKRSREQIKKYLGKLNQRGADDSNSET